MKVKTNSLTLLFIGFLITAASAQEQLVVFTNAKPDVPVLKDFNDNYLHQIKDLAKKVNIKFSQVDANEGLPAEVTSLPSIYYISNGKKILYKGRYGTIDRIKSFIINQRTFGFSPRPLTKQKLFVREADGFQTGINLKITPLTKQTVSKPTDVTQEVTLELKAVFSQFLWKDEFSFKEQSKLFYLNIYPYQSASGKYYLSYEIFSQHHCLEPVYKNFENPAKGKTLRDAVHMLGKQAETKLLELLQSTDYTDGLMTSTGRYDEKSWDELGISLSKSATTNDTEGISSLPIGKFDYKESQIAPINFTFPPPVSQYAGSISKLDGSITYGKSVLQGVFFVDIMTLDMGDPGLNESVITEQLLGNQYRQAKIQINHHFGTIPTQENIPIPAKMSFMGKEFDIKIQCTFNCPSKAEVIVLANFDLDITPFSTLEKPDGPAPQNSTVKINASFKMAKQ